MESLSKSVKSPFDSATFNNTVTTGCDKDFIWGAYLLIASLRCHGVEHPIHVVLVDANEKSIHLFEQFERVRVIPATLPPHYRVNLLKPKAILTADTETVTWLDADCIVTANISPYLVAPGESLQVRMRSPEENPLRFRKKYQSSDPALSIPGAILEIWKKDVNERETPAITTTCNTDSMIIHRKHLGFITRWHDQIASIVPKYASVSESAYTYGGRISDELVFNSLLAFAHDAPPVSPYLLDQDPQAYLIHFSGNPKPWKRWQANHLKHFDRVIGLIRWAGDRGYQLPPLPRSFASSASRLQIHTVAHAEALLRRWYRVFKKWSWIEK